MTKSQQATADVFITALKALRRGERDAVLVRIARDKELAQDMLDLALIAEGEENRLVRFENISPLGSEDERRAGYVVRIKKSAEREMERLPSGVFGRIRQAILKLEQNPRPIGSRKLHGTDDYRLRVGSYRVLYTINDALHLVEIIGVGHRKDVYRGI